LALFGRRPPQRVDSLVMPASENLRNSGRYLLAASISASDPGRVKNVYHLSQMRKQRGEL
jgi:hypothetical protein